LALAGQTTDPSVSVPIAAAARFAAGATPLPELEPRQFSFNSPFGACPDCHGVGTRREVNAELVLGDPSISILEGVILPWGEPSGYLRKIVLPTLAKAFKFDLNAPWAEHSEAAKQAILYGTPGQLKFQTDGNRGRGEFETEWEGVLRNIERRYREATTDGVRVALEEFMTEQPCQTCGGKRLKPESLAVLVHGKSIGDVVDLDQAISESNRVEYGLTAGIFSRDQAEIARFFEEVEAGVCYANKRTGATTGAWPGAQPFCGWKGSGSTGKGGCGPYYVAQFMREQSRTVIEG
jgi:excinuclease UvrABC ATPase subunit